MSRPDHPEKRRKLGHDDEAPHNRDPPRAAARFHPIEGGRDWTISVAIPGSMVSDYKTLDQRMTAPGRIARALAVFNVDEVVVYNDMPPLTNEGYQEQPLPHKKDRRDARSHGGHNSRSSHKNDSEASITADVDPCHFLTHVLSYLEAPPFMRKALFPIHPNLRLAGLLPGLDMPHHPNPIDIALPYREGVTIEAMAPNAKGTLVDIGNRAPVHLKDEVPPKTRVTIHLPEGDNGPAEAVHPAAPREDGGYYWGYTVRNAASLSAVFEESPHEGGYDLSIGTSERGDSVNRAFPDHKKTAKFKHLLVVFGGPKGIENAAYNDAQLYEMGIGGQGTRQLFDHWVNVLPGQGSRTMRTDEAVFVAMAGLRRVWDLS
ncbi:hypothetical protein ACHAQH_008877 [Verticillium albo-atrum]